MEVYQNENTLPPVRNIPLLRIVTSKQLIREIDLAFKTWRENMFSKDCTFEDFCEYILPFYRGNSFVMDDARSRFYQLYKGQFYQDNAKSVLAETDSLVSFYQNTKYTTFCGSYFPILSTEALEQVGGSRCTERGVFNSLLLSALGVPVAIDFVPRWGNIGNAHSWNVILIENKHYAFDSFLLKDRWYYNRLYANVGAYDPNGYGELRVAKVYRKTYSTHLESTLLNKGIPMQDIPPLFCNFKMRDVSSEYFDAVNVEVNLTKVPPKDAEYAYLCVSDSKEWIPVQFGKIKNGKVVFNGMGKNIVYSPFYYENGNIQVASTPFLLRKDGTVQIIEPERKTNETLVISGVWPDVYMNKNYFDCMKGANIVGNFPDVIQDTLCVISSSLPFEHTTYKLNTVSPCRFLRLNLPSDSIALGDLSFYSSRGKIEGVRITSPIQSLSKNSSQDLIFDDFKSTCYRGKTKNKYVDIDLGDKYVLTSIEVYPYVQSSLLPNSNYELFFWDNDWKSLGEQKGGVDYLEFKNVPRNALLRLQQFSEVDEIVEERIFLYKDGEVVWM